MSTAASIPITNDDIVIYCNYSNICDKSFEIVSSPLLILLNILQIIFNSIAIFYTLHFSHVIFTQELYHPNFRIILYNFCLCWLLHSFILIGKNIYDLRLFIINIQGQCHLVPVGVCLRLMGLDWLPASSLTYAIMAMALERTIATFCYKIYEHWRSISIGLIVTGIQWSLAIYMIYPAFQSSDEDHYKLLYCDAVIMISGSEQWVLVFNITFEFVITVIVFSMLIVNRLLKKRNHWTIDSQVHNLSQRFQLNDNVRTTSMITRMIMLHCQCVLISQTSGYFLTKNKCQIGHFNTPLPHILQKINQLFRPIFCIGAVLICTGYSTVAIQRIGHLFPMSLLRLVANDQQTKKITPVNDKSVSKEKDMADKDDTILKTTEPDPFDILNELWDKAKSNKH